MAAHPQPPLRRGAALWRSPALRGGRGATDEPSPPAPPRPHPPAAPQAWAARTPPHRCRPTPRRRPPPLRRCAGGCSAQGHAPAAAQLWPRTRWRRAPHAPRRRRARRSGAAEAPLARRRMQPQRLPPASAQSCPPSCAEKEGEVSAAGAMAWCAARTPRRRAPARGSCRRRCSCPSP